MDWIISLLLLIFVFKRRKRLDAVGFTIDMDNFVMKFYLVFALLFQLKRFRNDILNQFPVLDVLLRV